MSREWLLYLDDLIESCRRIQEYTEGLNRAQFEASRMVFDATVRNVELLGEAAKNIPLEIQSGMQDIPWRSLASVRNILAHAYFSIDNAILWDIVSNKVPELQKALERHRARLG